MNSQDRHSKINNSSWNHQSQSTLPTEHRQIRVEMAREDRVTINFNNELQWGNTRSALIGKTL
jgi:hypothetical protein